MPGDPDPKTGWLGTKNGASHRIWLPAPACDIIAHLTDGAPAGFVFANSRGGPVGKLALAMQRISAALGVEPATPHDLRRTHGTTITALGFGREAMNRVQNHREGGIADVYDRHEYGEENRRMMEAVAARIVSLAEGHEADDKKVVTLFK
jgi:integrase